MRNIISFLQFQLENVLLVLGYLAAFFMSTAVSNFLDETLLLMLEILIAAFILLPFALAALL
jgi:hypothetical protein